MKLPERRTWLAGLLCLTLPVALTACTAGEPQQAQPAQAKSAAGQQVFASPEEAVKALQTAAAAEDQAAMRELFGPDMRQLQTGDKVQDAIGRKKFAAALAQRCQIVKEGENKVILEIGPDSWPMPIPLVKAGTVWYFDTAAGKEEIINRHIGQDELTAIGVCREYVTAQKQYAAAAGGGTRYAQKFRSSPGMKDGLYWPAAADQPVSPFGPLVAAAHAEGYGANKQAGPHPFHGYLFRILTRQGKDAPGGEKDYMTDGNLTGGFALVAYPDRWDRSGIMTFIVNQDGRVFQCNLGKQTAEIAGKMTGYNPGNDWTLVEDTGLSNAASEK